MHECKPPAPGATSCSQLSGPKHFTTGRSPNATGLFSILATSKLSIGIFSWDRSGFLLLTPDFDKLFAFGIDPVDGGLPSDQPKDWPSVEQIRGYNTRLRETLDRALVASSVADPNLARLDHGRLLEVAIEHRLMHVETLCYMLHQLPMDRKYNRAMAPLPPVPAPVSRSIEIPAGIATLGLARGNGSPFGWDNEFEEHRVEVPAFAIDSHNVTNGDYLRFMLEGGYSDRALWTEAGWEWIASQSRRHPTFWTRRNDSWVYRTMFDEVPLPLDWPVYVSHDEASAYCRWAGKELPSEAEWHRAACATRSGHGTRISMGRGCAFFAARKF